MDQSSLPRALQGRKFGAEARFHIDASRHVAVQNLRHCEISIDKLQTSGNILYQDSCSYHKLGSTGIKVPCRTLGEQKSFKRRNHFMATKKKAAKKKKH